MLVIVSDLHLHDGTAVERTINAKQFQDFWHNINRTKRKLLSIRKNKQTKIHLVFLGDFFDLIRSQEWSKPENKGVKPWDPPSESQKKVLSKIIQNIFNANKDALDTLRKFVAPRDVKATYMIGNHDHLLMRYPDLFQKIHKDLGLEYPEDPKPLKFYENSWPEYGVLAHHGDRGDPWNDTRGILHPIGDVMVTEIYNLIPEKISRAVSGGNILKKALQDVVYVRPYRVAPFYVLQVIRQFGEEDKIKSTWNLVVEEFLELDYVKHWIQESRKFSNILSPATALKATLKISHKLRFKGWISLLRTTDLLKSAVSQTPSAVKKIRNELQQINDPRIRYLVKGHTHNPGVLALGKGKSHRLAYVNTGTWTRTLLPDRLGPLEPVENHLKGFTPSDFISYAVFYTKEENPHNDMEFWSGRINPREI